MSVCDVMCVCMLECVYKYVSLFVCRTSCVSVSERGRKRWLAEKCLQVVNDGWLDRFLAKITFCCEITGNV